MNINIAVPKGRLLTHVNYLFGRIGAHIPNDKNWREYYIHLPQFQQEVNIFIAKPKAIPQLLESGLCQFGFCGSDIMTESLFNPVEIYDTQYSKVDIVLATRKDMKSFPKNRPIICATEFPNIASSYFSSKGLAHYILNTSGSTEGYCYIGADCVVDICDTGKTIEDNGLEVKEVLTTSSLKLYGLPGVEIPEALKIIIDNPFVI